ncbi:MAG TPA: hypothetical protein VFI25_03570 [Planctomycetota bacterium]|nr:hypothetical protein [Planctomycetota bacterium]
MAVSKAPDSPKAQTPALAAPAQEPGAEPYAVLPDGTRYYWVKGARKDANGNFVPHVYHVAAQPIERDGVEVVKPAATAPPGGSPR